MLSDVHFYHRITRKIVVAFGNMFNNLKMVRYSNDGLTEIERITVPVAYATKEKFYTRLTQDPTLSKEVQITLPRMSFELASITYDPLRKRVPHNKHYTANNSTTFKSVTSTPYNFEFNLNVYVRNTEDGTQIIEQILPYFNPDYTVTIDLIGFPESKVDVPIVLNSISNDVSNDVGGYDDPTRMIIWTLNFSAKGYLYGPIESAKLIRKVQANTYYDGSLTGIGTHKLVMTAGSGNYKIGELVYTGTTLQTAVASAYVDSWSATTNTLIVVDTTGDFKSNTELHGAVTGTTYNIQNIDYQFTKLQLEHLTVVPKPLTANVGDDYGFTETLREYPNIV